MGLVKARLAGGIEEVTDGAEYKEGGGHELSCGEDLIRSEKGEEEDEEAARALTRVFAVAVVGGGSR